jgi:FkbM family methyltransferase
MIEKIIKMLELLKSPRHVRALLIGVAAGVEHKKVLFTLAACQHVVDIGANRGQFALISRFCFPKARIDSFEPLVEPRTIYEKVFGSDSLTYMHAFAVGPKIEEATIYVSTSDDSSSLLPIGVGQTTLFPGTSSKETRVIQAVPLSAVICGENILSPALLKIDVQGFELETLKGCSSLLEKFRYVYVECSYIELYDGQSLAHEVIDYLRGYMYKLIGVHNTSYDRSGRAIQADFLFERENRGDLD